MQQTQTELDRQLRQLQAKNHDLKNDNDKWKFKVREQAETAPSITFLVAHSSVPLLAWFCQCESNRKRLEDHDEVEQHAAVFENAFEMLEKEVEHVGYMIPTSIAKPRRMVSRSRQRVRHAFFQSRT
jgi:hypothetical protein